MSNTSIKMTTGWKIMNSLWILLTLVPLGLLAYAGFFFIGLRANNRKWLVAGMIYLCIIMSSFVIIGWADRDHILTDIFVSVLLVAWVSCIIHSFAVRQRYLNIIFQRKVQYEYGLSSILNKTTVDPASIKQRTEKTKQPLGAVSPAKQVTTTSDPDVININNASVEEISSLPSIHMFLAKKIIQARDKVNRFESLEHIAELIHVQSHVLEKSAPYIAFDDQEIASLKAQLETKPDMKKMTKSGRLVDY